LDSAVVVTVMVSAETLVEELKNVIDSETAPGYVAQRKKLYPLWV